MKVVWTKRIAEKIIETMKMRPVSTMVNALVTSTINSNQIFPEDLKRMREVATLMHEQLSELSIEQIMMLLQVDAIIKSQLQGQNEQRDFFMDMIAGESCIFDAKEIADNSFMKNIPFAEKASGDYEYKYITMKPYELDVFDIPTRVDDILIDIPRVGCFTEEFTYPALVQTSNSKVQMAITPTFISTMNDEIRRARGKVLTLGLGMGYYAFMVSEKEDVESVTIIEKEQSVIDLFNEVILPSIPHGDKITVIKSDASEYLSSIDDGLYDYCFADTWTGTEDIEAYFAVKEASKKFRKMKIEYRIEEGFALQLSGNVWIEILKAFSEAANLDIPNLEVLSTEIDRRKENYIRTMLSGDEIKTPDNIDYYMNPKNIISLIGSSSLIF